MICSLVWKHVTLQFRYNLATFFWKEFGQMDDLCWLSWFNLFSSHFGAVTSLLWRRGCTNNSELNLITMKDSSLLHPPFTCMEVSTTRKDEKVFIYLWKDTFTVVFRMPCRWERSMNMVSVKPMMVSSGISIVLA